MGPLDAAALAADAPEDASDADAVAADAPEDASDAAALAADAPKDVLIADALDVRVQNREYTHTFRPPALQV